MDSGLAAVLGAAVGAVGTGAAAFVTGWWSGRQARLQNEALLEQTRLRVRAERLRDRREPRGAAYAEFIACLHRLAGRLHECVHSRVEGRGDRAAALLDAVGEDVRALESLFARVAVEGPAAVHAAAEEAALKAREAHRSVLLATADGDAVPEPYPAVLATAHFDKEHDLRAAIGAFTDAARQALDDDGLGAAADTGG